MIGKAVYFFLVVTLCQMASAQELPLERIRLPAGFRIELLARVPNARAMTLGDNNVVYIGSMSAGKVYALALGKDYSAGELHVVASDLRLPIGVAWRQGSLFVSALDRILRFDNLTGHLANPPAPVTVRSDLPTERHHGGRIIGFGPDGWLYLGGGAPCNICQPDPDRYAAIWRMKPDGSQAGIFARGVRNTVGFDWNPGNGELWFTDNGRDMLGDDLPPDELNHAAKAGMHFGYPYCHGGTIRDPEYGRHHACAEFHPWTQNNDIWTATHPGGAAYMPASLQFWRADKPKVFRYQKNTS